LNKAHKTPVIGKEFSSSAIPVVDLTENDPPFPTSLDQEFSSYSPTL